MRFSLQDVKRQVRRREGELAVIPHFLRPGELRTEIARLVAYYEKQCGQPRKSFAQDEAGSLIGDYRLAHCLLAVLGTWYSWQQPAWDDLPGTLSEEARAALDEAEICSPVALRLALFDYVNAHYAGFLDAQARPAALKAFAALYHLDVTQVEYLLALDTEDEAILTRASSAPPDAEAVAALYNQWVFEAALFSASEVYFVIDCDAFLAAQQATSAGTLTGIGAVIKRLCYLARKLGVYFDLEYEDTPAGARGMFLRLILYGPQEMTSSPQQYGQRLARLCRLLFRYGIAPGKQASNKVRSAVALGKALRRAEATVYLFQKAYRFVMDAELLALLPAPEAESEQGTGRVAEAATIYDSSIEQSFAEAFAALERGHGTSGWRLEREPEPLLPASGAGGIFIPDFALTRGPRRIYVEILGFWTPAYRERKIQKLQQLKGRGDLVLAIPVEARQSFAGLATDYPLIEYRDQLSATDLLHVVQEHYDDFAERLAALDKARIGATIQDARFVPEYACYDLFNCYRRSELARATAETLDADQAAYTPGVGAYLLDWLEHLHGSFVKWVEAKGKAEISLPALFQECREQWPELVGCDDTALETLIGLWPEVRVRRDSIFEARLVVESLNGEETLTQTEAVHQAPVSRRVVRERRAGSKKQLQQETNQQNLWEE